MNTPKYVDYKNTAYLKEFMNPYGRMIAKKRTNVPTPHQRDIESAIKRARFMGLVPYIIK